MSEETQKPPESPASPPPKRPTRSPRSVFQYIAILFAAAFVLLLFTLLVEKRQNERLQQVNQDQLQQNNSAVQTLQGLMDENEELKVDVGHLQAQIDALEKKDAETRQENSGLQIQLNIAEAQVQAMTWFWQLNDAYVRGNFKQCRALIESMEAAELTGRLPTENTGSEDYLSPADRYAEIYDRVMR
ncbi:MAG: hypothetical protein HFF50_10140 [Lawsonibacter sp.]|nr:hypothetical protein [Lawsonibacter sp.]